MAKKKKLMTTNEALLELGKFMEKEMFHKKMRKETKSWDGQDEDWMFN